VRSLERKKIGVDIGFRRALPVDPTGAGRFSATSWPTERSYPTLTVVDQFTST
jgi:hypothetical protein